MGRARSDEIGPGQRFAVAIIEVGSRLASRGNTLTLRWMPSHLGIEGNEIADDWAKRAAEDQGDSFPRAYLRETSFAHMARRVAEARSAGVSKWIVDHVNRRRRYNPPKDPKLRKKPRHERKALAGRYYQLLSVRAATGDCPCNKIHSLSSDKCGWRGPIPPPSRREL